MIEIASKSLYSTTKQMLSLSLVNFQQICTLFPTSPANEDKRLQIKKKTYSKWFLHYTRGAKCEHSPQNLLLHRAIKNNLYLL